MWVRLPPEAPEQADVMELVYVSVLEAEFCEFESHHPHQSTGVSIMDNTMVFYTTNRGSIPLRRTI